MLPYFWRIDVDHYADPGSAPSTNANAVGITGPGGGDPALTADPQIPWTQFQMFDDDGNLYYEGRIWCAPGEEDGEALFSPLDDFGMPNAGCTEIHYLEDGKWEPL